MGADLRPPGPTPGWYDPMDMSGPYMPVIGERDDPAAPRQKRRKVDSKAMLADDVLNPAKLPKQVRFSVDQDRNALRRAKRFVFDEAACRMAVRMIGCPDGALNFPRFLDNAEHPTDVIWIEASAWVEQDEVRRLAAENPEWGMGTAGDATVDDRTGWLFVRDRGVLQVFTWMHTVEGMVATFPVYHLVSLGETRFPRLGPGDVLHDGQSVLVQGKSGRGTYEEQTAITWNIEGADPKVVKPLIGRARIVTRLSGLSLLRGEAARFNWFARNAARGLPFALCYLAMLNTIAFVDEEARPPGQQLIGGTSRPYLTRCAAKVVVPRRIRRVTKWALDEMRAAAARKRLHEVSAHYRHLRHKPLTDGWVEVEIEGETYWRKRIDQHLRGDPDLGVVEHDVTLVKGAPDARL